MNVNIERAIREIVCLIPGPQIPTLEISLLVSSCYSNLQALALEDL